MQLGTREYSHSTPQKSFWRLETAPVVGSAGRLITSNDEVLEFIVGAAAAKETREKRKRVVVVNFIVYESWKKRLVLRKLRRKV